MSRETKTRKKERQHFEETCKLIMMNSRKLRKKNLKSWRSLRSGMSYKYPVGPSNSDKRW
jgi:hypothetical protein